MVLGSRSEGLEGINVSLRSETIQERSVGMKGAVLASVRNARK
jgi:hypothetical protein